MSENFIGEICNPRWQTSFSVEWKIPNYFSIPQGADTYITSPTFHFANASWFLRLYPNGRREDETVEWMGIYLGMQNSETETVTVNYNIGIKYCDGEIYEHDCQCNSYDKLSNNIFGFADFIERSELLEDQREIISGGTLTVFCTVSKHRSATDAACQTESVYGHIYNKDWRLRRREDLFGTSSLSRDFRSLLHTELKSDVVIKVDNTTFPAHKLVLGTRSSVFAAMFEHDMKENSSGIVNIADCDATVFRHFLSFIYTGKIENLFLENVFDLFTLSDKYDLSDLKQTCTDFMKQNLCLDMVCEVMVIADKHNDSDLKASAKELIVSNIKSLMPTEQWISFMKDNPLLATELLMTAIPDNDS